MNKFWWKIIILLAFWLIALYFVYTVSGKEDLKYDSTSPYLHAVISNLSVWKQFQIIREDRVRAIIISTAEEFKIDPQILLTLAKCESNFDPKAKNPNSSASGIFQFVKKTWSEVITELKQPDWNVFNPLHNVQAAAYLYNKKGIDPWSESYNCLKKNYDYD